MKSTSTYDDALGSLAVRIVAHVLEDLEPASGDGGMRRDGMLHRNERVPVSPDDERRHLRRQVEAGRDVAPLLGVPELPEGPATLNHTKQYHHDRDDKEDVNQPTHGVVRADEPDQPEDH
jgi:hypothetical protein